ncbi:hypothetical protein [Maridesulfovibrio sp.]|uniref:hypothetical protein n=1 Tax=Maridesulfovibrio sp. TaxID=2795000 RepID=UPI0029CA35D6|nr:hypothetical protein [Maridesulfovibrio sp.]
MNEYKHFAQQIKKIGADFQRGNITPERCAIRLRALAESIEEEAATAGPEWQDFLAELVERIHGIVENLQPEKTVLQ